MDTGKGEAHGASFKDLDVYWLEESIFPPEDFVALARLRAETGVAVAIGENACTAFQFKQMIDVGAADYLQPSVTKVGGITEARKVAVLAETHGVPGCRTRLILGSVLATLHLMASVPNSGLAEWFYLERGMHLWWRNRAQEWDVHSAGWPGPGYRARYRCFKGLCGGLSVDMMLVFCN